ncbi:hypothetical protein NL676_026153 [Syzygium grande]|nr:hypothetical protein NL676_026153 [Syzygium grande]
MLFLAHVLLMLMHEMPCLASSQSSSQVAPAGASNQTRHEEVEALLKWKSKLDNESRSNLSSWNGSSPCSWRGIICDSFGSVKGLNLRSSAIRGNIQHLNLSHLPNLVFINLPDNQLFGNIPPIIGDLPKLEAIDFSQNNLSGNIPTQLGSLRSLRFLLLPDNNFAGPIPSFIGNMSSLERIVLGNNQLSGVEENSY